MLNLSKFTSFNWDRGNKDKNWVKHKVANSECEEVFLNHPLLILPNIKHSQAEIRYHALGKTNNKRLLFISFTIRRKLIRIISARDMNKKERRQYL